MTELSVLIPSRNEMFLSRTIQDILEHIEADTEIIAVLDGQWADPPIPDNPRVTLVYHPESIGQRAATNEAARLARGKYVMKCDAHCAFDQGFDAKMLADMQDDWTCVPVMKNLHIFNWVCEDGHTRYQGPSGPCKECGKLTTMDVVWIPKPSPQSTAYCFDATPHFQYMGEFKKRPEGQGDFTETMSLQGSCFMLTKDKYFELGMNDESWGSWGSEGLEIAIRTWLSGGKCICNHKTWYAHLFRTQGGDFSFPYALSGSQVEHAKKTARETFFNNQWEKQIHPLSWLIEKFWPVPGWTEEDFNKQKDRELELTRPGVYSIENIESKKIYIGSSANLARRFSEHLRMLHRNDHENDHLQKSWNKYGESKFRFNVEYFCSTDKLVEKEQEYLNFYKDTDGWDNLYNINPNANSGLGRKHTQESLDKMSVQQSGEGNGFYGKQHSEESLRKMSLAKKGRIPWNLGHKWPDEVKEKISEAKIGSIAWNKGLTKETDERVSKYAEERVGISIWNDEHPHPKGMLGKKHTDEVKSQISASMSLAAKERQRDKQGHFISQQPTKGIVWYTDNQLDPGILLSCQQNLGAAADGIPIVSVSLAPLDFGQNIVINAERGYLTMFKQILAGLEALDCDQVFLCEHDVLYHPSHFTHLVQNKLQFDYNINVWKLRLSDGHALHYDCQQTSGLCASRDLLLQHYRERVRRTEAKLAELGNTREYRNWIRNQGFEPGTHNRSERVDDYKAGSWSSEFPNVDIRHDKNLTPSRWSQDEFRNKRYCAGWVEAEEIPGWGSGAELAGRLHDG